MKKSSVLICLLVGALVATTFAGVPLFKTGAWTGAILLPGGQLTIVFNLESEDGSSYTATCDSPDQSAFGIPVKSVSIDARKITLELPSIGGKYVGELQDNGTTINGTWHQSGMKMECNVEHGVSVKSPARTQMPEPPFPYLSCDVVFKNPQAPDCTLAGTLTQPDGEGPFPGIVLVHGSGPVDRDETVFGHKPFLVLADHLTRNGFAVLRYDKRGIGESTGDHKSATTLDFASDAIAALNFLRQQPGIDSGRTGLIGHSEGGLIAPYLAARHPELVKFIVMLAGPGVPGKELLPEQLKAIQSLAGADKKTIESAVRDQDNIFRIVLAEPDLKKAEAKINAEIGKVYESLSDEEKKLPGMNLETLKSEAQVANLPWTRFFLTMDPRTDLRKVTCPVLALFGGKDCQVPLDQNKPEVEKALKAAGNTNVEIVVLDSHNHLFQLCKTGAPDEYAHIEHTISKDALDTVTQWLKQLK